MTEKRFSHDGVVIIDHLKEDLIYIDGKDNLLELAEYVDKLQGENEQLKAKLREKEQDEQLYADEIVKLNKEAKEVLDFKSLGGDY